MMSSDRPIDHHSSGLSWREAGTGAPVIFLHGLGGTRAAWGPQLRGLAPAFRCIAWDMPGYGNADPVHPLTYRTISERLVDLIDEIEADRVDLVGLSFGGMHALHTAVNFPERIRRLVVTNTSPAFGMDGTIREDWTRDRLASLEDGGTPADGAEHVIDSLTARPLTGRVRAEILEAFGDISADGYRAAVQCLPTNDVRNDLGRISHPSLVVVGDLDRETPLSYAEVLHSGLVNSRLEVLAGVGHLVPSEAPERFNELVTEFLGEQER